MGGIFSLATSFILAAHVSAQVVQWDIEKRASPAPRLGPRADDSVEETIVNDRVRGGYFASCSIGTPPQNITLQLDTGSSDIWAPATSSSSCERGQCTLGSYDYQQSSTYTSVNEEFKIAYADGSSSAGTYITESFGIGDVELTNMTMGLGLQTDIAYGIVGVGLALNEASVGQDDVMYNNLPIVMRDEGYINSMAYSLWLNDLEANRGNILFGGIDTDKYEGTLTRINIQKDASSGQYSSFTVMLSSLTARSSSGEDQLSSSSFPIPVVLDSGTTQMYLPQDLAEEIWREVGVEYTSLIRGTTEMPLVPCDFANNKGDFAFGFGGEGGPVIQVGLDELVIPAFTVETKFPSGQYSGRTACQVGVQIATNDFYLLGDTFLRSAYVVYDLENREIGLAPTNFNATKTNVVPFPSRGAQIPSSTPAPSQNNPQSSPSTPPDYGAEDGFKSSANMRVPDLCFTKVIVVGACMGFAILGGDLSPLF